MIRLLLVGLFLILFLILTTPLMLFAWILGKFNYMAAYRFSLAVVRFGLRGIKLLAGVKLTVVGEENVPKDTPVLYVGNHRSFFDIVLTYARVPRPTSYVSKIEIKKVPLLNLWMMLLHCTFLDRKDAKKGLQTILTNIDLMKKGISVCIFPEGTRNHEEGTFLPFHDASFKIASKSGCPVLPMALTNTGSIFEDHFPWIRKTKAVLRYGKPVYIQNLDKEQQKNVGEYFRKIISDMYEENRKLL